MIVKTMDHLQLYSRAPHQHLSAAPTRLSAANRVFVNVNIIILAAKSTDGACRELTPNTQHTFYQPTNIRLHFWDLRVFLGFIGSYEE